MKKLLVTAALLLPSFVGLHAQSEVDYEVQEKILAAIDNQCGDTWCEGDFYYIFRRVGEIEFKGKSTTVTFIMGDGKDPDSFTAIPAKQQQPKKFKAKKGQQLNWVSCTIPGYASEAAIMSGDSLNWDFYLAMSDCIESLEKNLRAPR